MERGHEPAASNSDLNVKSAGKVLSWSVTSGSHCFNPDGVFLHIYSFCDYVWSSVTGRDFISRKGICGAAVLQIPDLNSYRCSFIWVLRFT